MKSLLTEWEIENTMESSLINNEFQVYLQPKYSLISDKIVGAEALIRWNHPDKGLINPDKFINIFEKNGFINVIDTYV